MFCLITFRIVMITFFIGRVVSLHSRWRKSLHYLKQIVMFLDYSDCNYSRFLSVSPQDATTVLSNVPRPSPTIYIHFPMRLISYGTFTLKQCFLNNLKINFFGFVQRLVLLRASSSLISRSLSLHGTKVHNPNKRYIQHNFYNEDRGFLSYACT